MKKIIESNLVKNAFTPIKVEGDCICFDMDGVLAEWGTEGPEPTKVPGYFYKRPIVERGIELIKSLDKEGYNVVILSAVYTDGTAAIDKIRWLNKHGLSHLKHVFVPYGKGKKCDYINCSGKKMLIDDYSKNLHEWEDDGGIGVKFMNGFNGHNGTWKKRILREDMSAEEMITAVKNMLVA